MPIKSVAALITCLTLTCETSAFAQESYSIPEQAEEAERLRESGWSERQIEKFLGLNFLRGYEEVFAG